MHDLCFTLLSRWDRNACKTFGGAAVSAGLIGVLRDMGGDIETLDDVVTALAQSGADGVMIGRGAQGRPWFLAQVIHYLQTGERLADPPLTMRLRIVRHHFEDMLVHYGTVAGVRMARKHLAWYSKGLRGAAEYRSRINKAENPDDIRSMVNEFYQRHMDQTAPDNTTPELRFVEGRA